MPADATLESIISSNPELFEKELQQLRQSARMENKMRQKAKAQSKGAIQQKLNTRMSQKAAQKTAVKEQAVAKNEQTITAENQQAEDDWNKELTAFKAIQQKKVDQKRRNENLVKTTETIDSKMKQGSFAK